ncbi:acyltransferase family protein [Leekyejoonella antrihumi]|uniref:Acyltransferase n=1 Tax=Leekyejoonella antrihumi TaxID=1660198 RepID=A0A563E8Y5_9MICO|nr:acyltransferase family protein [Leekyejoonella antrihumi]TWP38682.1 acyltransferase [Leekyejoonella antrihumi]
MSDSGANKRRSGLRADVEGLRAVAVLLVISDHLFAKPSGGFVGVDVFFVISGFLITGLLVREVERTGSVSFRSFYARRVRRIAPAAFVTLLATCLAARLIYVGTRAHETLVDAMWAAGSLANWHFAAVGTDYFQQGRPPSALQHYWSLAVEEQFYFVWPLLIISVAMISRRRRRGVKPRRLPLGVVLAVLVVVSFAWSMYQSSTDPTVAYFSTMARAWELGVGALIALCSHRLARVSRSAAVVLSWVGLGAIALSALVIQPSSAFPAPWGALPVLGTAAVIVGGMSPDYPPRMAILTNPVSRYVGRISYSLYLWHWTVITLLAVLMPAAGPRYVAWVLAATMVLSVSSYHGVEDPIRRSCWLTPRRGASRSWPRARTAKLAGSFALAATTVVATTAALNDSPVSTMTVGAAHTAAPAMATKGGTGLSAHIQQALDASAWPKLSPSVDDLDNAKAPEWKQCGNVDSSSRPACVFGSKDAPKTRRILVLGDSIGISWLPGIRAAMEPSGWQVAGLTFGLCPAARLDVTAPQQDAGFTARCSAHQSWELKEAVAEHPSIVVLAAAENTLTRMPCCKAVDSAAAAWQRAEQAAVTTLAGSKAKVVILSPPPQTKSLAACATRFNAPSACVARIDDTWYRMSSADREVAHVTGARYVDTHEWFCTADGICPPFVGHTTISADGTHLTGAYSKALGPVLRTALIGS